MIKYSEKDMAALISEVETQFAEHLKKAESEQTDLTKNESEEENATEAAIVSEEIAPEDNSEEDFDYSDEDITEMDNLYGSMGKSEAEAHYKSLKKTLFGDDETTEIAKAEEIIAEEEASENSDNDLKKFESENEELKKSNEELKKSNEELKKNLEGLISTLTESVKKGSAPKGKAITKIQYIAKSEEENKEDNKETKVDVSKLSKSEIAKKLNDKIREGKLEKSDKDAINSYYLGEKTSIESIKHLL